MRLLIDSIHGPVHILLLFCNLFLIDAASVLGQQDLPLLHEQDLRTLGAFRLPRGQFGGSRFSYSGAALAFNHNDPNDPTDDSLFISGHVWHPGFVAEISIPEPRTSTSIDDLAESSVLQEFTDLSDGKIAQVVATNSLQLSGLLVYDNQLIWTVLFNYDASGEAHFSHGTSSLDLSNRNDARGIYRVGNMNPGVVAGYMATIPNQWIEAIGAPILTGMSNANIITRTSAGPTAVAFDPDDFSMHQVAPAMLLMFNGYAGVMKRKNPAFNFNSSIGGMAFPSGTRSVLYFGGHAGNDVCYGTGQECHDPHQDSKGWHDLGGQYFYQIWAYDARNLIEVKKGQRQPQDVQPYAIWNPKFPLPVGHARIGGVAYDTLTNRIFLVQLNADRGPTNSDAPHPLIQVLQVKQSY